MTEQQFEIGDTVFSFSRCPARKMILKEKEVEIVPYGIHYITRMVLIEKTLWYFKAKIQPSLA